MTPEYNECFEKCGKFDEETTKQCEKVCSVVYDKYALLLQDRYKDNKEKLYEEVSGARSFDKKRREHTQGLFYKVFGWTWSEAKDAN